MTESMIERVAEAIYQKRNGFGCKPWARLTRSHQEPYKSDASAAIAAMREPTHAMQAAIRPKSYTIEHYHGNGHHRTFPTLGAGPVGAWQDMIDAALNDKGSE